MITISEASNGIHRARIRQLAQNLVVVAAVNDLIMNVHAGCRLLGVQFDAWAATRRCGVSAPDDHDSVAIAQDSWQSRAKIKISSSITLLGERRFEVGQLSPQRDAR